MTYIRLTWTDETREHLRDRSRHGQAATALNPAWADQAASDPDAVVLFPDPDAQRAFNTARILGISAAAQRLLTVITSHHGSEHVVLTAFPSASKDRRRYHERNPS